MNTMTTALRDAGAKLPSVKYRIWHWLKDHPEKTCEDIQKALALGYKPGVALRDMEAAGVLKVYSDVSKAINPTTKAPYKVKRYSVVNAFMFMHTERKPTVRKPKTPLVTTASQTDDFNPEKFVSKLTLPQVKQLYVYLYGVFK